MEKAGEERKAATALTRCRKNQFLPACEKSGGEMDIVCKLLREQCRNGERERNLWSEVIHGVPQMSRRGGASASAPPFPTGQCIAVNECLDFSPLQSELL